MDDFDDAEVHDNTEVFDDTKTIKMTNDEISGELAQQIANLAGGRDDSGSINELCDLLTHIDFESIIEDTSISNDNFIAIAVDLSKLDVAIRVLILHIISLKGDQNEQIRFW